MRIRRSVLALMLLSVSAASVAAEVPDTAAADAVVERLLFTSCEVGDGGTLRAELLEHAASVVPRLIELLDAGPDAATIAARRATLEATWERRQVFLATGPDLGLSAEDLAAARGQSAAGWVERGLADFDAACRERAVHGLAAIRSRPALEALIAAREAGDAELTRLIERVLERPGAADRLRTDASRRRALETIQPRRAEGN